MHFYTSILKKYPFLQRYDNFTKFCSTVLFCVPSETILLGWFSVHKINLFWHKSALRTFYMTTTVDISLINFFHNFCFQKKEWSFQPCLARPFFVPSETKYKYTKIILQACKKCCWIFFLYLLSVYFKFWKSYSITITSKIQITKSSMSPPKRNVPSETHIFQNAFWTLRMSFLI